MRAAVVVLKAEPLHVLEKVFSDVVDDILTHLSHHNRTYLRKYNAHDNARQHRHAAQYDVLHAVVRSHGGNLVDRYHVIINRILNYQRR